MKLQAEAFCDAIWQGEKRRFALALKYDILHFWDAALKPELPPQEYLFVGLVEAHSWYDESNETETNFDDLFKLVLGARSRGEPARETWARVVAFDNKTDVLLHPSGRGEVRRLYVYEEHDESKGVPRAFQQYTRRTPFLFSSGSEVLEWSLARWQDELNHWAKIPDNDFAFAVKWSKITEEDIAHHFYCFARGDWPEMEKVSNWLFCLESDALSLESSHKKGSLDEVAVSFIFYHGGNLLSQPEIYVTDVSFPDFWRIWFDFFSPSLNREMLERHIAARQDISNANQEYWIQAHPLTAHERLEVRLQLRDWLSNIVGVGEERIVQLLKA